MSNFKRLAALAAVLVVLAACGTPPSGSGDTTTTVDTPTTTAGSDQTTTVPSTSTTTSAPAPDAEMDAATLFASLREGDEVTSARIEGAIEMTGLDDAETGITEATIYFSTAFNSETGDSEFVMDMSSMMGDIADSDDAFAGLAAGMLGNMEMRQIGDTVYLKYPFITAMMGAETEWVSMPADESDDFASGFETMPTDPDELIDSFDDSGATVEVVGTEEVNGVQATHYRVSLDISEMELTPEEEAEMAEAGIWSDGTIPLEIWVSDAGYMVRMIMEIDGTGMPSATGEEFETMVLRYDMFDINGDVVIEAPPADQVSSMEDLENAFGGLDG